MSANLCICNWSESTLTCRAQVSADSEYAVPCEQLPHNNKNLWLVCGILFVGL